MDVSIVIPNYNGEKLLKENLPNVFEAALNYKNGKIDLIVADDASTDNSISVLREFQISTPARVPLYLVIQKKNLGFSGNVNAAVNSAKGQIVVLLNSDVVPQKNFLEFLIPHFNDQQIFAVGSLDQSVEDNKIMLRGNGTGKWEHGFLMHKAGDISKKITFWASGGSSAFRKSVWDKLGGLNNIYNPFYWEDIDLSYRAWKAGYIVIFEKNSIVRHEHEKGAIKSNTKASRVKTIAYRNQFLFVWLNITDLNLILSHLIWLPIHCIQMFLSGEWLFFRGLSLALIKLPQCLKYRLKYKKLWKLTDYEVLNKFT